MCIATQSGDVQLRAEGYIGLAVLGVGSALVSLCCQCGVHAIVVSSNTSVDVLTFYSVVGGVVVSVPGLLYEQSQHCLSYDLVPSLAVLGLLGYCAQTLKFTAVSSSESQGVLLVRYVEVCFSVFWDVLLFHTQLTWHQVVGVSLILVGCVLWQLLNTRKCSSGVVLPTPQTPERGDAFVI